MSSPIPTTQENFSHLAFYLTPPIAASVAIVPVFYGFVAKSAQQLGEPIPRMSIYEALKGGYKAAPTIGTIVGTQMIVQGIVEKELKHSGDSKEPACFSSMLASSALVGGLSAPALAVFNGQTMGRHALDSLKALTPWQAGAIVSRETSFLLSLRVSDPAGLAMKRITGDTKAVEYSSAFVSGAVGSVIGHPADTALTLWQRGAKVSNLRQLMRGAPVKSLATGGFSVCYKVTKEALEKAQGR